MIYLLNLKDDFLENAGDRPALGTLYLSSYLESKGINTRVFDLNHTSEQTLIHAIISDKPEWLGVSFTTPHFKQANRIAKEMKSLFPNIKTIAGGVHPSVLPESLRHSAFDMVVKGEGEKTLEEIIRLKIFGGEIEGKRTVLLDELPIPAYNKLKLDRYALKIDGKKAIPVITSRGCPYSCVYCTKEVHGSMFRSNTANYVGQMIELLHKVYDYDKFIFYDDVFTLDKKRIKAIKDEFKMRGLKIGYRATTRFNCVDEVVIEDLKESGCLELCFGVESGNDIILDNIKKQQKVKEVFYKNDLIRKSGIKTKAYFMIGLPGDTLETVQDTINVMKELDADEKDVYILAPYPGTQLWNNPSSFGIEIDKDSNFEYMQTKGVRIATDRLSKEKLIELWNEAKRYRK